MSLQLDVRRHLLTRSDRVKAVDLHPAESWLLVSLYDGSAHIWDFVERSLVKSFKVCVFLHCPLMSRRVEED